MQTQSSHSFQPAMPGSARVRRVEGCQARVGRGWLGFALALLALSAVSVRAANLVHEFYLPMPEAQIRQTFLALETNVSSTIETVFSVVVTGGGTVVHFDQWEDGYETDLANPVQATTQIWGDGNNANGIAPGFVNDPTGFNSGAVLFLRNLVPLPRNPANLLFDARDRIAATKALVVARAGWATTPGTVLAGAVEVQATIDYGTNFVSPVGQDLTNRLFQYVAFVVQASSDGTTVTIDTDGPGVAAPFNIVLNRGESHLVNGGVKKGGSVTATKPIQVDLVIGRIAARYATDWFALYPVSQWSSSYYTPVGTSSNNNATFVYLFNPNTNAITVNYTTKVGSGSLPVPANGGVTQFQMPKASGARFISAGNEKFFALSTVGANPSSDAAYDWGFTLLPENGLTSEAVVGWGPGSSDGSVNGSPVWVTAPAATRIYVDLNGDRNGALTDPLGGKYDLHLDITALDSRKIYDPDKDQTAMRLYTLDGTSISAAWGEDPDVASPGNPYLDFGTTVLPFPVPVIRKSSAIFTDNNTPGLSVGDVLEYTIELDNRGLLPLGNTVVIDAPPPSIAYVAGSTTLDGNAVPDNVSGTAFPLDAPGYTIPIILRGGTSAFKYRTTVNASGSISNTVTAVGYNIAAVNVVAPPPSGGATSCGINFSDSIGAMLTSYAVGDGLYVTLADGDKNTASNFVQTVSVVVRNFSRGDLETITLTETGVNTGVFRNTSPLPSSAVTGIGQQDGTLNVAAGDLLSATFTDTIFGDTCVANATVATAASTKFLYLSDPAQALDRVDPVAANDLTTSSTAVLGGGSAGAISVDNATSTNGTTMTITNAHVVGTNANRLLLVGVSFDKGASDISTITYGGTALTNIVTVDNTAGSVKPRVEIWRLVNPSAGSANVLVTFTGSSGIDAVVGVTSLSGVDQATPVGNIATNTGNSAAGTVAVASAAGEKVLDTMSLANTNAATAGAGQTQRWSRNSPNIRGAGSTEDGGASVTMSWSHNSARWAIAAVAVRPASAVVNSTATFTQSPAFCQPFTVLSNRTITVTNFVTVTSGSMPASPSITARLTHGGTNIATLASPTYTAGPGTLVWSGTLASNVTVPAGAAIALTVSNAQAGVGYTIDFDSVSKPSKIALPTASIIDVTSLGVYDAPYPGGTLVTAPAAGSTLYVRAVVSDPFGSYDITSVNLAIDGPGVAGDLNPVLNNASVVVNDGCTKTYEYVWTTGSTVGNYDIAATANEGTEGVTDVAATAIQLTFLDLGTPSTTTFTSGDNGPATNNFATNQPVCVRVNDQDQNTDSTMVELLAVVVASSSGDSETLTLTETSTNSGVFTGCLTASTTLGGATNNGTLLAPVSAVLTATYVDPNDGTDISGATATVPPVPGTPGVSVSKTLIAPADGQAGIGEAAQFNLQIVNTGSTTLTNVALTDTYPAASLTFVSASLAPNTTNAGSLVWNNVGPLTAGQSVSITVNFTAAAVASPAVNLAAVNAGGGTTNGGSAGVTITRSALTISKTLLNPAAGPVNIGSNVTFRIAITNTGTTAIPSLPLEDTFSAGCFQFVSATLAPGGAGAGSLFWADVTGAGSLAAGASLTIDVTMLVVGGCDPANNTAFADYAVDQNGDPVPSASGSVGVTTLAAKVTGKVYNDLDQSGTLTGGDVGLQGVTVQIFTDPNADGNPGDGALVRDVMTLADGSFELINLAAGNYVVVETDPPGFASSAPLNNRIATNITSLTTFSNANFFDYLPAPVSYATVNGNVWNDANLSGTRETNEVGVTNAILDLVQDVNTNGVADLGEPIAASLTTGINGAYTFANVVPGAYVIRETDLFGWISTGDAQGANDNQIAVVLGSGAVTNALDFLDYFTGNTPTNDPPVAFSAIYTNAEDTALAITLTGFDIDGPATNFVIVDLPASGALTGSGANRTYTPNTNFTGADSFTFTVNDGSLTSAVATISITITPVNDPPVAVNDSASTPEDTAVLISVLVNDSDVDGGALSITGAVATNGTVTIAGTNLNFLPATNFSGNATIGYTISDGNGDTVSALVTINVTAVNDPPVAVNDSRSTPEDTAALISVLVNDSDIDGGALSITGATATNGTVAIVGTNLNFLPAANFSGNATIGYTISDGNGGTANALVTVTVTAVNDPPVAVNDMASTPEDTQVTIPPLVNDSDVDGDTLTITLATSTNGTVNIVGTNLVFLPATNFNGTATINYTISDGTTNASAVVTVNVTAVNDPPVAVNDAASTPEDTAVLISVLINDSDIDGGALSITGATATNGTVSIAGTNLSFLPATNFSGNATIGYTISDGNGGTASALVTVTVTAVNDPPVAFNDTANTLMNQAVNIPVLVNDSDVDGNPLTITIATTTNGVVNIVGTNLNFLPATNFSGGVTLTYVISDGSLTSTALVSVAVGFVNLPPVANNDSATTVEDTQVTVPVLVNDSDPNSDPLTITLATSTNGTVNIVGTNLVFLPATNFNGTATINYTITDGTTNASAVVTVTVTTVNDPPVAINDTATTTRNQPVVIPPIVNDSDPDGDPLTFTNVSTVVGTIQIVGTNLVFTPSNNFTGTNTITYSVVDPSGAMATATIVVTVSSATVNPVANNDSATTPEDTAVLISVLVNDTDADGDTLAITSASPTNGTVSIVGTNLSFLPATNFNGTATIGYAISDGFGGTASALVTVTVTAVNDPPVAVSDSIITGPGITATLRPLTNDFDVDGDLLTIVSAVPSASTVTITNGTNLLFVIPPRAPTNYSIVYVIADPSNRRATNTINLTILPVVADPVANDDTLSTTLNAPLTITAATLLTNDFDINGQRLTVTSVSTNTTQGGTVSLAGTNVLYTPPTNFLGADTFTYTITNVLGRSATATVTVNIAVPQFGLLAGPIVFNPQTGLFEQLVTVTNIGAGTVAAHRVHVDGLRAGVTLYNATGSISGVPYVQFNSPLNPGQTNRFRLEFFVPDRLPFTDTLTVEAVLPTNGGTVAGTGVLIDRSFFDLRLPGDSRYVIEFNSLPGRIYTIIYSDDNMATWKVATPSVTAGSNRTQWYDDGPPKTDSPPGTLPTRFYQVILAPILN